MKHKCIIIVRGDALDKTGDDTSDLWAEDCLDFCGDRPGDDLAGDDRGPGENMGEDLAAEDLAGEERGEDLLAEWIRGSCKIGSLGSRREKWGVDLENNSTERFLTKIWAGQNYGFNVKSPI